jgi:hypothetical protein
MDFQQVLRIPHAEKENLDRVIASLEELLAIHSDSAASQRPGRKSISEEERREVSARMKRFWAEQAKRDQPRPGSGQNDRPAVMASAP